MSDLIQPEHPTVQKREGDSEPSESATLKIVLEPLGAEVSCTVPERHSAKMVQIAGIVMATLGPVLMLWVGASTAYPDWMVFALALALIGGGASMSQSTKKKHN